MVSRERLLRLGANAAERATTKRVRMVAQLLLLAALIFIVLRVRSLWHDSHVQLGKLNWLALIVALVLGMAGTAAGAFIWLAILEALGVRPRLRWAGLFFQAQLGKYIPGAVWQYAGRAAVARAHGIAVRPVGISIPVELIASSIAGASMAGFLLGWWGGLVVAAVALVLVVGDRSNLARSAVARATIRATLLYLPVWLVIGGSFWLSARGLVATPAHDSAFYTGVFAVAWLAGLLAIYAPGGLGVREAVLVGFLSGRIGAANALVVAAVSRLILTFVDVGFAGVATLALRLARRRPLDLADPA
jgi:uncharacterized membrane protein YbhN (UPF0104 family)